MRYDGYAFTDSVTGKGVGYYTDKFGRQWLAQTRWARFRVGLDSKATANNG